MNRRLLLVLLSALLILGAACGGGDEEEGGDTGGDSASEKSETPETEETEAEEGAGGTVTIEGVDFAFKTPGSVAAGETEITFENNGKEPHQLIMALLKEGAPPIEELVKLPQKEAQKFLAEDISGEAAKPIPPGKSTSFTAELKPGTYGMVCFVESKGKPHAFLGMVNSFTVE
ncbi:MAG: hypothetical protein M3198_19745 [Actinomycetota bacterium]|nr:hypothetical protein [Actinomycetota bacterium]